jgi:hypothetical protein
MDRILWMEHDLTTVPQFAELREQRQNWPLMNTDKHGSD